MPSTVALLLCTAFVLFLLRVEQVSSPRVSAATWIPTVWMLLVSSKALAIWLGMSGIDNESGSVVDRLALSALAIAGVLVLASRHFDWAGTLRRNIWLVVLLAYMLMSTLWSDITLIALRRWFRDAIILIMVMVILSERYPRLALESLMRRTAYILIPFSLLLIKFYPALGRMYGRWSGGVMWVGVSYQKNGFGQLCLISASFLLWALYRRWRKRILLAARRPVLADVLVLLIALYLFKGSENAYSATAVGSFAIAIAIFGCLLWLRKKRFRVPKSVLVSLVAFLIAFGTVTPFAGGSNVAPFSGFLGRDETITDRTEIWAAVLPYVDRHPLFGFGYGSFWTTARRIEILGMPTSHNGYLDTRLELGIAGLAFFTIWLLSTANKLHAALTRDYEWASLAICFLFIGLATNVTESVLNSMGGTLTALIVFTSLVLSYEQVHALRRRYPDVDPKTAVDNPFGVSPFSEEMEQVAASSSL